MLTTLIDLATTGSAIGLVLTLASLGVAVLPWRTAEARSTSNALDAMARLPFALANPAPAATSA